MSESAETDRTSPPQSTPPTYASASKGMTRHLKPSARAILMPPAMYRGSLRIKSRISAASGSFPSSFAAAIRSRAACCFASRRSLSGFLCGLSFPSKTSSPLKSTIFHCCRRRCQRAHAAKKSPKACVSLLLYAQSHRAPAASMRTTIAAPFVRLTLR